MKDENDRLIDGTLPDNPEDDAEPYTPPGVKEEKPEPVVPMISVADALPSMFAEWATPKPPVNTGLAQLNTLLSGGIRAGDMVALVGLAKGGKSALFGQVLYDAVKAGALGIYASVEMPRIEVVSRWIAREAFLALDQRGVGDWPIGYGDVLYGRAHRLEDRDGNPIANEGTRERVQARLQAAVNNVAEVGKHLFVEHLRPGSTPATLRSLVLRAREQTGHSGVCVLLVDPIQRIFAHESEMLKGRALERTNAEETPRVTMAAQQIKEMVDDADLNMAVLFTSDTTKSAAFRAGADSSTDMRGTYMLNHVATTILGVTSGPLDSVLEDMAPVKEKEKKAWVEQNRARYEAKIDMGTLTRDDAVKLGAKAALVECSGNRRGPADEMMFTYVPGGMYFVEAVGKGKGR